METKTRREFLKFLGLAAGGTFSYGCVNFASKRGASSPNIVFITADDMNYDSPGCCGCTIPDITPHIDDLASQGIRFTQAHVNIAVCQPCRESIMTGRYPHRNGGEGFQPISKAVPTLQEQLRRYGYMNGIMGKTDHLTPKDKFCWDFYIAQDDLGMGRDPSLYYHHAKRFLDQARKRNQPFFLMANSHDPHRPFAGSEKEKKKWKEKLPKFSRRILPEEVEIPGFVPDLPEVRQEVADYYTSVHRCDESVGAVLQALADSGYEEDTLVIFFSDHGMSLPFAKTNCYLNSTKTPWIVRWPGKTRPGTVDQEHFISGIDFMPTVLDAAGIPMIPGMDGFSFLPLLFSREQGNRERVFTQFHETAGKRRYPMRCVQDKRFGYIINFWSDGETVFRNESRGGKSFKAMAAAAESDKAIKERVLLFDYRVREEFYHFEKDPDALNNLIDHPQYPDRIQEMRERLLEYMVASGDHALAAFRNRENPEAIADYMKAQREIAEKRKKKKSTS